MQEKSDFKGILGDERLIETAVIILFVSLFVFLKLAQPWDYRISHPYPAFYNANDNFVNGYVYPQYIKEAGNFVHQPPQLVGGFKDVVGYYPPLLLHLSAMFSTISGIETYDATYLIITLFSISAMLLVYFVIRRHSKDLAIISLPFMIGIFNFDFEIARAFGLWIFITGTLFLASVVWIADRLSERYSFIFLAVFLAGAAHGHMSEAIFAVLFLSFYYLLKRLKEGAFDKAWLKNAAYGLCLFFLFSAYYLIVFKNTWMIGMPYKFEVMSAPPFAPNFGAKFFDFGIAVLLVIAGLFAGIKKMIFRKTEEFPFAAIAAGLFVLIIGYTNYVGFGIRAWQTRIMWPVYFAVFAGIALFIVARKCLKNWKYAYAACLSVILILSFSYTHQGRLSGSGIIDDDGWNMLMWVKNNTPHDSKVAYFYGLLYSQTFSLWSAERVPYPVILEEYIDAAQSGKVKGNYSIAAYSEWSNAHFAYQKSVLDYGYRTSEEVTNLAYIRFDSADYYVFPVSLFSAGNEYVAQYNAAIRDSLLNAGLKEVYKNGGYSVVSRVRGG